MTIIGGHIESPWSELARRRVERRALGQKRLTAATAEWEAVRDDIPEGSTRAALTAVLELHSPEINDDSDVPNCASCMEGFHDVEQTEWPCSTYEMIRDNLKGQS